MDVNKIAKLARLEISEDEQKLYADQLGAIFEYFEQISGINTNNIEPMVTPTDMVQFLRPDEVIPGAGAGTAVASAPEKSGHLFKVPPVV